MVSIEKRIHDFEISPPDVMKAVLLEPTSRVQLVEGQPIIIRFKVSNRPYKNNSNKVKYNTRLICIILF